MGLNVIMLINFSDDIWPSIWGIFKCKMGWIVNGFKPWYFFYKNVDVNPLRDYEMSFPTCRIKFHEIIFPTCFFLHEILK